jgi:DNA-binding NarL/FixJ family response regulator
MKSATARKLSVCLLASHPLVLSEFHRLLRHAPFRVRPEKVRRTLTEGESACVPPAGVYVIDYNDSSASITSLVSSIMGQYPDARVLLVGDKFDDATAFPLLRMGVKGLLELPVLASQLQSALQSVGSGGYWVPRAVLSRFVNFVVKAGHPPVPPRSATALSRREREVAEAVRENMSNKEIANKLNISERTVKFHVSNLLRKFGVGRRADLIVLYYQEASRAVGAMPASGAGTSVN